MCEKWNIQRIWYITGLSKHDVLEERNETDEDDVLYHIPLIPKNDEILTIIIQKATVYMSLIVNIKKFYKTCSYPI